MRLKGRKIDKNDFANKDYDSMPIIERDMTWCDLLFIAASEVSRDKVVLLTRYPMNYVA